MIGIVGAGLTGLSVHHYLRDAGIESVVFEAASEPGGVVRTVRAEGRVLECGPQRTRLTSDVRDLVDALALGNRMMEAADEPLYVYRDGSLRRVPFSIREAVETDLLSWRGKLRALCEPLTAPPRSGESVEGYLSRAFGREVADRIGGPLYAGLYASDPAHMPVEHSLARALDRFDVDGSVLFALLWTRLGDRTPPPVVSFDDGLQVLPEALADAHADSVRLDSAVRSVRATNDAYLVETASFTIEVDELVVTSPAAVTADLLGSLDTADIDALRELSYNPLAVVHLAADGHLRGSGHQVPFREPFVTLGATWNDTLFGERVRTSADDRTRPDASGLGRDGVYTCYLGGEKTPEAVEWSDDRLGHVAAREFEIATSVPAEPVRVTRLTPGMPAYDYSWDALERVHLPDDIHLCTNYTSRAGIPGRIRAARRLASRVIER
ncbi:protoporphyrinogen oxidase [Halarchaeum nitratireducens]|uniref:Protoporphyrinogen oxidase n=1 Tax=Halarchaeum nitratireducens TaxID=489913 RepID=A0A830GGE3_9EURY|nr:protoporphyrinogen oxidase [Halarchaeum nitratireducens]GGN24525.1 protoporphyrinogen oxidase [Halarchaeum nitratireducens]